MMLSTMFLLLSVVFLEICIASADLVPVRCHGACSLLNECPEAYQVALKSETDRTEDETNLLRQAFCGFENGEATVCCDVVRTNSHANLRLLPSDCGFIDGDRIIAGKIAAIGEFPWMTLVSIHKKGGVDFACGATVISDRYVLTAAHCVHNYAVAGVRVGEHDLYSKTDCQGIDSLVCAEPVQDIGVQKVIIHENYTSADKIRRHDIALLRLSSLVNFKRKNAKPVCLPTSPEEQTRNLDGLTAVIAGWGKTETGIESNVLKKANIPILSADICSYNFGDNVPLRYRTNTKTFLCAGVVGTDSCHRDSGGPLLLDGTHGGYHRFIQYGVVSFGSEKCGSDRPSLYTDVIMHMPWILDHLEP